MNQQEAREVLKIAIEELKQAEKEIREQIDPFMDDDEQSIIRSRIMKEATDAIRQRAIDAGFQEDDLIHLIH